MQHFILDELKVLTYRYYLPRHTCTCQCCLNSTEHTNQMHATRIDTPGDQCNRFFCVLEGSRLWPSELESICGTNLPQGLSSSKLSFFAELETMICTLLQECIYFAVSLKATSVMWLQFLDKYDHNDSLIIEWPKMC